MGKKVSKYLSPGRKRLQSRSRRNRRKMKRVKSEKKKSWVHALQRKYTPDSAGDGGGPKKNKLLSGKRRTRDDVDDDDDDNDNENDNDNDDEYENDDEGDYRRNFSAEDGSSKNRRGGGGGGGRGDDDDDEDGLEVESDVDEDRIASYNKANPLTHQLFLRGLPSDADEASIRSSLSQFGDIKRVHIVQNKITKRSSGSVFVHFDTEKSADAAFQFAARNAQDATADVKHGDQQATDGMSHHQAKKVMYKLQQARFTSKDPFVNILNTRVGVMRPMERTEAQEMTSAGGKSKKEKRTVTGSEDPRNLYLLEEGVIFPGTKAAEELNPKFLASLTRDYELRKQQLRNVNLFVSRTRLSIRNIPRDVTSAQLRALLLGMVRDFLKTHKHLKDKSNWGKHGPITNLRILTDNQGQSRGFGFVEFVKHEFALHVLRQTNNNPTLFGPHRRLVVAFAIENQNALQKLERLKQLRKEKMEQARRSGFVDRPGDDIDPTVHEALGKKLIGGGEEGGKSAKASNNNKGGSAPAASSGPTPPKNSAASSKNKNAKGKQQPAGKLAQLAQEKSAAAAASSPSSSTESKKKPAPQSLAANVNNNTSEKKVTFSNIVNSRGPVPVTVSAKQTVAAASAAKKRSGGGRGGGGKRFMNKTKQKK